VLLPHLGSATHATREQMATMALTDAARVLRGELPQYPVNEVRHEVHTVYLKMNVRSGWAFVNINGRVADAVRESSVREGLCLVNAMHITASVFINDDEPGLHEDYKRWLEQLASL